MKHSGINLSRTEIGVLTDYYKTLENALFSRVLLCSASAACAHAFLPKIEEGRRTSFMGKIRMKKAKNEVLTLREVFAEFVNSQEAKGVAAQTVKTYRTHFQSVSKHLNMDLTFGELSKRDLEKMIVSMRSAGLANNSISSYVRVMKTFPELVLRGGLHHLDPAELQTGRNHKGNLHRR